MAYFAICLVFTLCVFLDKTVVQEKHETCLDVQNREDFEMSFLVKYVCASISLYLFTCIFYVHVSYLAAVHV